LFKRSVINFQRKGEKEKDRKRKGKGKGQGKREMKAI
jgi:hypothetical protein